MIVPSHIIPLASPGMIAKGIRWMFDSTSPFYVKPRMSGELLRWGYQFYRHANAAHVKRSIPALKGLSLYSKYLYRELAKELPFDFGYEERGLLMLYQTSAAENEEQETVHLANASGVEARVLSPEQVQALEPAVRVTVKGGVYYPGDAQLIPGVLMEKLTEYLKAQGVTFHSWDAQVLVRQKEVSHIIAGETKIEVDHVVLAAGAWSGEWMANLGVTLPMQAGKGYSFTLPEVTSNIRVPSILLESRVAVTPLGNSLRFGGTMEITGLDHRVNMNRVKGIVQAIPKFYPDMKVDLPREEDVWHGLRPCTPDGLPYIGRVPSLKNVTVATGHAMMGLSLGPATGQLVTQLITSGETGLDIRPFSPGRFA